MFVLITTTISKQAVFRTIVEHTDDHWTYYHFPNAEYTATDLDASKHDIH